MRAQARHAAPKNLDHAPKHRHLAPKYRHLAPKYRHLAPKYRHLAPKERGHVRLSISWRRKKHVAPDRAGLCGRAGSARTTILGCLVALAGFGIADLASAGFIVPGSGSGTATVISLGAPADVTASQISPIASDASDAPAALEAVDQTAPAVASLEVSWDPVAIPAGGTGGYFVQSFAGDGGAPGAACGSSPTSPLGPATTSCTDSGLVPGISYRYQVIAVYDTLATPSALSNAVTLSASTLSSFTLTPSTPTPTAGTPFTVTVTALDQYGGTYSGYTGPQCVTFSGAPSLPGGIAPTYPAEGASAAGSSVTFADGVATVDETLVDPGTTTLEVTDDPSGRVWRFVPDQGDGLRGAVDHHHDRRRDDLHGDGYNTLDDLEYDFLYRVDIHGDYLCGDGDLHRDHLNGGDNRYREGDYNLSSFGHREPWPRDGILDFDSYRARDDDLWGHDND